MSIFTNFMLGCGSLDEDCTFYVSDKSLPYFLDQSIDTDSIISVLESEEGSKAVDTSPKYGSCIGVYDKNSKDYVIIKVDVNDKKPGFFMSLVHTMKAGIDVIRREEMPVFFTDNDNKNL